MYNLRRKGMFQYNKLRVFMLRKRGGTLYFSHIRPLGAVSGEHMHIFHNIESYIFTKLFPSSVV